MPRSVDDPTCSSTKTPSFPLARRPYTAPSLPPLGCFSQAPAGTRCADTRRHPRAYMFAYFVNLQSDAQPKLRIGSHNTARAYVAGSTVRQACRPAFSGCMLGDRPRWRFRRGCRDTEPGLEVDIIRCYSEGSTRFRALRARDLVGEPTAQDAELVLLVQVETQSKRQAAPASRPPPKQQ